MSKYGVRALSGEKSILIGERDTTGSTYLSREDGTDEVMAAVMEFVHLHYNGDLTVNFRSRTDVPSRKLRISVEEVR